MQRTAKSTNPLVDGVMLMGMGWCSANHSDWMLDSPSCELSELQRVALEVYLVAL